MALGSAMGSMAKPTRRSGFLEMARASSSFASVQIGGVVVRRA